MAARLSKDETKLVIAALNDSIEQADRKVVGIGSAEVIRLSALEKANRMRRLRARLSANLETLDR
jgi:hypothetical protein